MAISKDALSLQDRGQRRLSQSGRGGAILRSGLAPPQRHHRSGREYRQGSWMPLRWPLAQPLGAPPKPE